MCALNPIFILLFPIPIIKCPDNSKLREKGLTSLLVAEGYSLPCSRRGRGLGSRSRKLVGWSHCIHSWESGSKQQVETCLKASSPTKLSSSSRKAPLPKGFPV
ncbi:mCG147724 [Mus musculus]|nr:mCG147724 [Mus musculus]